MAQPSQPSGGHAQASPSQGPRAGTVAVPAAQGGGDGQGSPGADLAPTLAPWPRGNWRCPFCFGHLSKNRPEQRGG